VNEKTQEKKNYDFFPKFWMLFQSILNLLIYHHCYFPVDKKEFVLLQYLQFFFISTLGKQFEFFCSRFSRTKERITFYI
jgi:hypothetical protein